MRWRTANPEKLAYRFGRDARTLDVAAVFAPSRLLASSAARPARARLLTRMSGFTMLGLGAWLALARRET